MKKILILIILLFVTSGLFASGYFTNQKKIMGWGEGKSPYEAKMDAVKNAIQTFAASNLQIDVSMKDYEVQMDKFIEISHVRVIDVKDTSGKKDDIYTSQTEVTIEFIDPFLVQKNNLVSPVTTFVLSNIPGLGHFFLGNKEAYLYFTVDAAFITALILTTGKNEIQNEKKKDEIDYDYSPVEKKKYYYGNQVFQNAWLGYGVLCAGIVFLSSYDSILIALTMNKQTENFFKHEYKEFSYMPKIYVSPYYDGFLTQLKWRY